MTALGARPVPAVMSDAMAADARRALVQWSLAALVWLASGPLVLADAAIAVAPAADALVDGALPLADSVVVRKGERRLYLMRAGEVLRSYPIVLGLNPDGPKLREGDFRTPEGRYRLSRRNPQSDYFLSIQVSYPNETDLERARRAGANPGGAIMIHGLPNNPRKSLDFYLSTDWTDGCIALSNSHMVELWLMTPADTPIEILP